jgi:hypothetical protein
MAGAVDRTREGEPAGWEPPSPVARLNGMKKLLSVIGIVVGSFLIVRAVIEPFVIDFGDPSTYHLDWGGPHLPGVLAVHCGPGVIALIIFAALVARRRKSAVAS